MGASSATSDGDSIGTVQESPFAAYNPECSPVSEASQICILEGSPHKGEALHLIVQAKSTLKPVLMLQIRTAVSPVEKDVDHPRAVSHYRCASLESNATAVV
jgi:hypothetical protein